MVDKHAQGPEVNANSDHLVATSLVCLAGVFEVLDEVGDVVVAVITSVGGGDTGDAFLAHGGAEGFPVKVIGAELGEDAGEQSVQCCGERISKHS